MQELGNRKVSFWLQKKTIYLIYFVVINALNIQSVLAHKMNVWKIFRQGFFHLNQHQNLYALYPKEYDDFYLYSPSFAAFFAPFSILPNYIAYFLWNNISMLLLPFLIFKIKGIEGNKKSIICYIALLEMATCLQGTQTNAIIAGLMVLTFLSFENKNYWLAAFAIAIGFYIKIYPIITASLFLLYPNKLKFLVRLIVSIIVIGLLPLLFIKPSELYIQYQNWIQLLVEDQGDNNGRISVTGLLTSYFPISNIGKLTVQILGVIIFCLMYLKTNFYKSYYYRLYFLCAVLIWVTIFNHASEIYGYAIAIWGVGIWYALQKPSKALNIFILLFIFFGTVLSIDPTPHIILDYIYGHGLKALPFTIMFGVIVWGMLKGKSDVFTLEKQK
jgi:Glycosyltransferase family 87